jgi:hypothetical protein
MGPAEGTCPHRGASFVDADANMNCTKRRPEEVTDGYVARWRWPDLAVQVFIHVGCLYGFYLIFTSVKLLTTLWGESPFAITSFSICALRQVSLKAMKSREMKCAGHVARMG